LNSNFLYQKIIFTAFKKPFLEIFSSEQSFKDQFILNSIFYAEMNFVGINLPFFDVRSDLTDIGD
jgi:hypothetical protein